MKQQENDAHGEVIKSFYVPGEEGISEFWRRNKSTVVSLELARLLLALRKLTGYIGLNVGSIIWEGMKPPEETSAIIIDPDLVRGKYPIPASKTDYVVGFTVREAYRRIEWSEKAEQLTRQKVGKMPVVQKYKFEKFLETAEKIYLDMLANRSILGEYAKISRTADFNSAKISFLQPPSLEELLCYWWLMAADTDPKNISDWIIREKAFFYDKPLRKLSVIRDLLLTECIPKRGVLERCDYRSGMYVDLWIQVSDEIGSWPVDSKATEDQIIEAASSLVAKPRLDQATMEALEAAIAENMDFSPQLKKIIEPWCKEEPVATKTGRLVVPMEEKLDRQLYLRVKAGLRVRSNRRNVISRGLKSGNIDPRRLYRASMTGEVFQYKKYVYEMYNDIALLIDASSSMIGPKWKKSQRVFQALFEALSEINSETRVFAYNEANDTCYITELYRGNKLYTVVPRGKTASGEAVIATALMLQKKKHRRQPLIIHITDGASNWGCDVKNAIEYCRKQKIELITLGLGCSRDSKEELKKEYGNLVKFIDDVHSLPQKFVDLVSRTSHL